MTTILPPPPPRREAVILDNFHLSVVATGREALHHALLLALRGYNCVRAWSDHPDLGLVLFSLYDPRCTVLNIDGEPLPPDPYSHRVIDSARFHARPEALIAPTPYALEDHDVTAFAAGWLERCADDRRGPRPEGDGVSAAKAWQLYLPSGHFGPLYHALGIIRPVWALLHQ